MVQNLFTRKSNTDIFHKISKQFKLFETHFNIFSIYGNGMCIFIQADTADIQAAFHIQLIGPA